MEKQLELWSAAVWELLTSYYHLLFTCFCFIFPRFDDWFWHSGIKSRQVSISVFVSSQWSSVMTFPLPLSHSTIQYLIPICLGHLRKDYVYDWNHSWMTDVQQSRNIKSETLCSGPKFSAAHVHQFSFHHLVDSQSENVSSALRGPCFIWGHDHDSVFSVKYDPSLEPCHPFVPFCTSANGPHVLLNHVSCNSHCPSDKLKNVPDPRGVRTE